MKAPETESRYQSAMAARAMVRTAVLLWLICSFASFLPAMERASPVVVQGDQWALYDVSSIKGVPYCLPYTNSGYSLEILDADPVSRRVLVNSHTGNLDCRAVFPPDSVSIPPEAAAYARSCGTSPELRQLARTLTESCRTQYQAVNRILCWVSSTIEYRTGAGVAAEPEDVLRQGSANCVGAAELSVALLREAGMPARGVRGFLASGSGGPASSPNLRSRELSLGQEGLHRWIEIYYPGVGWVFSDPFRSVNYVTSRYLVFALEVPPAQDSASAVFHRQRPELGESVSTFIHLLDRGGMILPTDVLPFLQARHGMTVRRNGPVQYRPAFIGHLVKQRENGILPPDEVHLFSAWGSAVPADRVAAVRQGVFSFTGLEEGEYRLVFYHRGECVGSQRARVHFPPRRAGAVPIDLGP